MGNGVRVAVNGASVCTGPGADAPGDGWYSMLDVQNVTPEELGRIIAEELAVCDLSSGGYGEPTALERGGTLYLNLTLKIRRGEVFGDDEEHDEREKRKASAKEFADFIHGLLNDR